MLPEGNIQASISCQAHSMQQNAILCMHPVFCLRKHLAVWCFNYSINCLDATLCRKAMQENCIAASLVHHGFIHLKTSRLCDGHMWALFCVSVLSDVHVGVTHLLNLSCRRRQQIAHIPVRTVDSMSIIWGKRYLEAFELLFSGCCLLLLLH